MTGSPLLSLALFCWACLAVGALGAAIFGRNRK